MAYCHGQGLPCLIKDYDTLSSFDKNNYYCFGLTFKQAFDLYYRVKTFEFRGEARVWDGQNSEDPEYFTVAISTTVKAYEFDSGDIIDAEPSLVGDHNFIGEQYDAPTDSRLSAYLCYEPWSNPAYNAKFALKDGTTYYPRTSVGLQIAVGGGGYYVAPFAGSYDVGIFDFGPFGTWPLTTDLPPLYIPSASMSLLPTEWWEYDPGDADPYPGKDGAGPVYDKDTGEQLRDPFSIVKRGDGTFYNPNYAP